MLRQGKCLQNNIEYAGFEQLKLSESSLFTDDLRLSALLNVYLVDYVADFPSIFYTQFINFSDMVGLEPIPAAIVQEAG